jgi:endoglucanase
MVAAHMDEVAFIATHIEKNYVRFGTVGGISPSAVIGRRVYFPRADVYGVVGCVATHLLEGEEKTAQPSIDKLFADIGENADKVQQGDLFYFVSDFVPLQNGLVKGKAIDDRAGCLVMLNLIKSGNFKDVTFVFTAGEETGSKCAANAAYAVNPDICIVLEATTACDIPNSDGANKVCEVGKGGVVSYMDRGTVYDRNLYNTAFEVAKQHDIPVQTKTKVAGGNDAANISTSAGGVRCIAVSVPCRYLHTASCVASMNDLENVCRLTEKLIGVVK